MKTPEKVDRWESTDQEFSENKSTLHPVVSIDTKRTSYDKYLERACFEAYPTMKDTITTLVLFICVGLAFIGTYWWSYYVWHKPVIEEPKVEIIKTPMPEWKAEEGKDKA